jgi:hypothetical protein
MDIATLATNVLTLGISVIRFSKKSTSIVTFLLEPERFMAEKLKA